LLAADAPAVPTQSIRVQVRYRRVQDWTNYQSVPIPQGAVFQWKFIGPRPIVNYQLKVKVHEFDPGDRYHFSAKS
jgi:hypothetical protein